MSMSGINSNIGQQFKPISTPTQQTQSEQPAPAGEEFPVQEVFDADKVGGAEKRDDVDQQQKSDEAINKQKAEKPQSKTQLTSKEVNRILLKQEMRLDRIETKLLNEIRNMAEMMSAQKPVNVEKPKLEIGKKDDADKKEETSKSKNKDDKDVDDSKYFLGSAEGSSFDSDTGGDGSGQGEENKQMIMDALKAKYKKGSVPEGIEELVNKMPNSNLSLEDKVKVVEVCNKSELDTDSIKKVMNVCSSNSFIGLPETTKNSLLNFIGSEKSDSVDSKKGIYQKSGNLIEAGSTTVEVGNISVKKEQSTSRTGIVTNTNEISSKTPSFELNVSLVEQSSFSDTPKLVDDNLLGSSIEISFKTKPNDDLLTKEVGKFIDAYKKESDIQSLPEDTLKQVLDVSTEQMKENFDTALSSAGTGKLATLKIPITQDKLTGELNLHGIQIGVNSELSLSSSEKPITVNNMNTFIKERNMQKSLPNQETLISKITNSLDIFNKEGDNKNFSFKTCGGVSIKSGETINVNFILKANDVKRF